MNQLLINILFQVSMTFVPNSWIYDDTGTPAAVVSNATSSEIAFTGFESGVKGYWTYSGVPSGSAADPGRTGLKYYVLSSGTIQRSGLPAQQYMLSYWSTGGTPTVFGTNYTLLRQTTRIIGGWTLTEIVFTLNATGSVTISGSGKIDDIKLHPADARMVNYTYDPLVGKTSETNETNKITFYEYDEFGRLALIRDQEGNILQTTEYHFKN